MTEVRNEYPPMIDKISQVFPVIGQTVIFSWGNIIYNPSGTHITPALFAHEAVHAQRQGDQVEQWWLRYLEDPGFRLAEEIPAHRAELQYIIKRGTNRHQRRGVAKQIAKRLSGPLYGLPITQRQALAVIANCPAGNASPRLNPRHGDSKNAQ